MTKKPVFDYPLFAMGFRVFFALAGLSALAFIALWNRMANGALHLQLYYPGSVWHAHEMLLGYASAVIAGFLLTAVRNWTGLRTVGMDQLAGLCFLWIYGRAAPFYAGLLPDALIAGLDFAFLPLLIYFLAKPILKTGQFRNLGFIGLLLAMTAANALIHAQILGWTENGAALGLNLLVTAIVLMIVIIAGRVFPLFIERGLTGAICIRNPLLDMAAIGATLLAFILLMTGVSGVLAALAAAAALAVNLLRLVVWHDRRIWYVPLLWVLYAGYSWLIFGFALQCLAAFSLVPDSLALHAFTAGGIGVLSLGMMARVSLGHTGRALKVSNLMALAFLLINLAALCRVLFPALLPGWREGFILAAVYGWLAAFALFILYYLPILVTPRVDGKEG